jgi:hypothetical protein
MLCGKYWLADNKKYCLNKICRDCEDELSKRKISEKEYEGFK